MPDLRADAVRDDACDDCENAKDFGVGWGACYDYLNLEVERLKQKLGEADEWLGRYGAGGSAAGTVPAIHNLAHRAEVAEARVAKLEQCAVEYCREWIDDKNDRCNTPAEFILWGKLLKPEALGPRCYDHAAKHVGHPALSPGANFALFDLRPFLKATD